MTGARGGVVDERGHMGVGARAEWAEHGWAGEIAGAAAAKGAKGLGSHNRQSGSKGVLESLGWLKGVWGHWLQCRLMVRGAHTNMTVRPRAGPLSVVPGTNEERMHQLFGGGVSLVVPVFRLFLI